MECRAQPLEDCLPMWGVLLLGGVSGRVRRDERGRREGVEGSEGRGEGERAKKGEGRSEGRRKGRVGGR